MLRSLFTFMFFVSLVFSVSIKKRAEKAKLNLTGESSIYSASLSQISFSGSNTQSKGVLRDDKNEEMGTNFSELSQEDKSFFSLYARIADAAYDQKLMPEGWHFVGIANNEFTHNLGLVAVHPVRKEIVVAFRGTDNLHPANIIQDLDIRYADFDPCANCKVSAGFSRALQHINTDITFYFNKAVKENPDYKVIITGHSLGGAMASVFANRLGSDFNPTLVTYGSPRTGNREFCTFSNNRLLNNYRVVYKYDVITMAPPTFLGYEHFGKLIFFTDLNTYSNLGYTDNETWFSPRSISDHLQYRLI